MLTYAIGFIGLMQEMHKRNKLANKMIKMQEDYERTYCFTITKCLKELKTH